MRRLVYILAAMVLFMVGCTDSRVSEELIMAEAMMEERPDSALAILREIDGSALSGESQARHALLLSQAYDKNYIDQTNDSLISIALNYYTTSSDEYHKMLAFHYMGVVKFNAGDYEEALNYALQAYELARRLNDQLNLCRIASVIGCIHRASFNYQTAYEWHMRSLALAKALNPQWALNSYYHIAENFLFLERYKESLAYADSSAMLSSMPDLAILEVQYLCNHFLRNNSTADSIYSVIIANGFQPSSEVIAGQALIHPDSALEMLDKYVEADSVDITSKADIEMAYVMTYLRNGDSERAYRMLSQHVTSNNALLSIMGKNPLEKVQQAHSQQLINEERERTEAARHFSVILCVIIGLLIIIAVLLIMIFQSRQKVRQAQRESDLMRLNSKLKMITSKLDDSESELSDKQTRISALEEQINALNASRTDQAPVAAESVDSLTEELDSLKRDTYDLLVSQFSLINAVGSIKLKPRTAELPEEGTVDRINSEIDSLSKDKTVLRNIDSILTIYNPELKQNLASLSLLPTEYELAIYILFGLSTQIIALLMNKSERAVYNLKSRLKKKLEENNTEISAEILGYFTK
ncbi:MAG: tetratricopeptide repeat protein [Bacteroidales bacterium]|nr:tetratricopeptide repeat protein [Bacteroidales bacterium]